MNAFTTSSPSDTSARRRRNSTHHALMVIELVLDAGVSPAWFLKETSERAACAAAVNMAAADGTILHLPAQWRIEMGRIMLREHRR